MQFNYEEHKNEAHEEVIEKEISMTKIVLGAVAVVLVILTLVLSVVLIPAGNVGVVTRFGAVNRVANAGISMKIPFIEGVHRMSIRTQKDEVEVSAASSNLQTVSSVIAVNYHLDPPFAATVYAEVGRNYQELVLAPAIQDAFKAVTARYTAEQLIQKRDEVSIEAEKELQAQVDDYHIRVESFNIINFDFSPEYNAAIEAKQVAEQEVSTARQRLQKAQVEAQTKVAEAEGIAQAQAALKKTGALTPEYLQYLFLSRWDGKLPQIIGSATPIFDVSSYLEDTKK